MKSLRCIRLGGGIELVSLSLNLYPTLLTEWAHHIITLEWLCHGYEPNYHVDDYLSWLIVVI